MRTTWQNGELETFLQVDPGETQVLDPKEERRLLLALAECKAKLARAVSEAGGAKMPQGADSPGALAHYIADFYSMQSTIGASLGAVYHRYAELRRRLAMANLRLVAHMANRFRDRGVSYPDLIQEGFCGLLEAIDRFDVAHGTKLSTYATWWIRQALQQAVAAGSYPVRLSPRHLRQLAQNQEEFDPTLRDEHRASARASEMLQRIHTATQPTVSLDAALDEESSFNLLETMSDPEGDQTGSVDTKETISRLMQALQPREQQVLSLRFGLGGTPRHSLSQVGKVLEVSKERVRQIQDRALEKLRTAANEGSTLAEAGL